LNDDLFADGQQRQKNINVDVVVGEVADVDLRGAGLGRIVPDNITVARIARGGASVGKIEEQIG
jgi:hypothetical protein